jgi:hypothetical protein
MQGTQENHRVSVRVSIRDACLNIGKDSCLNVKKNFALRFINGAESIFETYSEAVRYSNVIWLTSYNDVIDFPSLTDMSRTVMKIQLLQKRKGMEGLFLKLSSIHYTCLGLLHLFRFILTLS